MTSISKREPKAEGSSMSFSSPPLNPMINGSQGMESRPYIFPKSGVDFLISVVHSRSCGSICRHWSQHVLAPQPAAQRQAMWRTAIAGQPRSAIPLTGVRRWNRPALIRRPSKFGHDDNSLSNGVCLIAWEETTARILIMGGWKTKTWAGECRRPSSVGLGPDIAPPRWT